MLIETSGIHVAANLHNEGGIGMIMGLAQLVQRLRVLTQDRSAA